MTRMFAIQHGTGNGVVLSGIRRDWNVRRSARLQMVCMTRTMCISAMEKNGNDSMGIRI